MTGAAEDKTFELLGDYSGNGAVDAADYVLWQEQENQTGPNLAADGDDNGVVNGEDWEIYHDFLGNTLLLDGIPVA